jgi:hypothetical protein
MIVLGAPFFLFEGDLTYLSENNTGSGNGNDAGARKK